MDDKRSCPMHSRSSMQYGDYLTLDSILSSQLPLSDYHDEMLFIIIHQASELWIKLILHELASCRTHILQNDLEPAFKMLARISLVHKQLIHSWDILTTLTPSDYLKFRDSLGSSSGFQSHQYRMLEFYLGSKNKEVLNLYANKPQVQEELSKVLLQPSIYDVSIQLLVQNGFVINPGLLERDWSEPYKADPSVRQAWLQVYRENEQHWQLYQLAEKLVDLDYNMQHWRFRHMLTVERVIGLKTGTGGSAGVLYLRQLLDHRFFPELWDLRTDL